MLKSKYKWNLLHEQEVLEEDLLINVLLKNRKVSNGDQFFNKEDFFYDPFLFNDMKKTIDRIYLAINQKEKIMLYGDYDVDGVSGTAILYRTLKKMGGIVEYYIPNRFTEGYGPNLDRFKLFVEDGYQLIITIDNGITGIDEANYLKEHHVDFIITDHHEGKEIFPDAFSIIHPKLPQEHYPFKDLAGCGVAYKLSHALLGYLPLEYIDLACLGTYADIVSALEENRSIIKLGLKQLRNTSHVGLQVLTELAKVKEFDEFALGFVYGPRLNAPGRMLSGNDAVKLLVTEDYDEAVQIANDIEKLNKERKLTIDTILEEAIELIESNNYHNDNVIVIASSSWHEGVLGIAANRLVETYHKPVIVLTESDNVYKGSCRTLEDFPLFENLSKCHYLLEKYGGHKMAAGIQLQKENIDLLRKKLHLLAGTDLCNFIKIDCIPHNKMIKSQLIHEFQKFRPFGPNNEQPIFLLNDYEIVQMVQMGSKNNHLRLVLKKEDFTITAIAFNKGHYVHYLNEQDVIDVVGTLEINEYNGKTTNQLMLKDIRCNKVQIFDYRSRQLNIENQSDLIYIYFEDHYGYQNAVKYEKGISAKNIVLIDIPDSIETLKDLIYECQVENIYLLLRCNDIFSSVHLMTREKMGKFYQVIKKYKRFKLNNDRILYELSSIGFDKKLQKIAIKVFFELNFVIIENDEIIIVENPEKRNLTESHTFKIVNENIQLKEKLLLSSTNELKEFILKLSNGG